MKLIDIDSQKGIELLKEAEAFLRAEYPPQEWPDMYDVDGDMCLDEHDYHEIEIELHQKRLVGVHGNLG